MKMKLPSLPNMGKVMNDKNVLYIVFIIAILNILGYLLARNTEAIVFFLMVGFLTTYFSKNMIVILLVAMISTSLFTSTKMYYGKGGLKEGMEGKDDKDEKKDEKKDDKTDDKKDEKKDDKKDEKVKEGLDNSKAIDNSKQVKNAPDHDKEDKLKKDDDDKKDDNVVEGITGNSNNKSFISHADTIEHAYKNLGNLIGEDGIKGLTDQTGQLLNQQQKLMSNITSMQPFLESTQQFMDKLDFGGLDGIGDMLSKITGKKE